MPSRPPERDLLSDDQIAAWRSFVTSYAHLSRRLEADLLAEHDLALVAYEVLVQLLDAPERQLRMTELADRVLLSRSGVTRVVDRLQAEGLILREVCDDDGRGTYAVLTDAGVARLRAAAGTYFRGLRHYLVDQLPAGEVEVLGRVLGTLSAHLNGDAASSGA